MLSDSTFEEDETFTLLTAVTDDHTELANTNVIGTILNVGGENLPSFAISDAAVIEGGILQFEVVKNGSANLAHILAYSVDWGDTDDTDVTTTAGTLTFAAAEISKTISILTIQDNDVEADEVLFLSLTYPNSGSNDVLATATGLILNDDQYAPGTEPTHLLIDQDFSYPHTLTSAVFNFSPFLGGDDVLFEGHQPYRNQSGRGPRVLHDGSLTSLMWQHDLDFTGIKFGEWTFPKRVTVSKIFVIPGSSNEYFPDQITLYVDGVEKLVTTTQINISQSDGLAMDYNGVGFFIDLYDTGTTWRMEFEQDAYIGEIEFHGFLADPIEEAPTLVDVETEPAYEGQQAYFKFSLSDPINQPIAVQYQTAAGSAVEGVDYSPATGTVYIDPGETEQMIAVPIADDSAFEGDETFTMTASIVAGDAAMVENSVTATILNVGGITPPSFSVNAASVSEGGNLRFEVVKSGSPEISYSVSYRTLQGTADSSDFNVAEGTLVFAANDNSKFVDVQTLPNSIPEEDGGQPFRFTGRRFDSETGLYYYRARYYSSKLGRFLQTDPIGYEDNQNLYAYTGNDPVNNTDSTGLNPAIDRRQRELNSFRQSLSPEGQRNLALGAAATALAITAGPIAPVVFGPSTIAETGILATEIAAGDALGGATLAVGAAGVGKKIANDVPNRLARIVPNNSITRSSGTLGGAGASDVFVTAVDDVKGLNADELAKRLTIPSSPTGFRVVEFPTPSSGIASPVNRLNPGFVGGGRTAGGAREFVIPNGKIPKGALERVVK